MKRLILSLLAVVCLHLNASITGSVGNSINWEFNESTGTLVIEGEGDLKREVWFSYGGTDYYEFFDFKPFAEKIRTVTVSEGITRIVQYTFQDCINLVSVSLPNTLLELDDVAFYCRIL